MTGERTFADTLRALRREAPAGVGYTFVRADKSESFRPFGELAAEGERIGRRLLERGLQKGDRLALILPDGEQFVLAFFGAIWAGVVPVPMSPPLSLDKLPQWAQGARHILAASGARALATSAEFAAAGQALLGGPHDPELIAFESLDGAPAASAPEPEPIGEDDLAFLQFTSGSTEAPRGVRVTHKNLVANCIAIQTGLELRAGDVGVSWLPLYHDMGLIGFVLTPIRYRHPVVFLPPLTFIMHPRTWMAAIHRHRATVTFAPNFAFSLAAARTTVEGLDLSCLRVLGCGAEPIQPATMRQFLEKFAPAGLRPGALLPCYGMAEATLAITFRPSGTTWHTDRIQREPYHDAGRAVAAEAGDASALEMVSCGRTVDGHAVEIVDADGQPAPERTIGEIVFQGPSVAAGYHENPEATRALFEGGRLRTGDLGYLAGGDLYVTGRKKDLIILSGRNHDPQTIERVASEVPGVRRGNVVAFSRPGAATEELVVVAEARSDDRAALAKAIRARLHDELQLAPSDVRVVPPSSLPKTSSGKLQRSRARQIYLDGGLTQE